MKTTLKTLIAVAITVVAAAVSTGASAASITERHAQHSAQVLNVQFRGDSHAGVHRATPVRGHHGFHGRGFGRHGHFNGHHSHHRGHGGRGFNR